MSRSHTELLRDNDRLRRENAGYRAILLELEKSRLARWLVMRAYRAIRSRLAEASK